MSGQMTTPHRVVLLGGAWPSVVTATPRAVTTTDTDCPILASMGLWSRGAVGAWNAKTPRTCGFVHSYVLTITGPADRGQDPENSEASEGKLTTLHLLSLSTDPVLQTFFLVKLTR